jgi:signal transduction histidine kinase
VSAVWRFDVALGAVTALVVAVAAGADVDPRRPDGPGAYAFALGFGLLMLARRRRPVPVLLATAGGLLAYYALGFPPIGLALPIGAALFSAAEAGRSRWAAGVAAALVVITYGGRLADGEGAGYLLAYELPTTLAVLAAAIGFGDGRRSRRLWHDAVLAAAHADRAQHVERERLRVARDVHDVLAHTMSVVTLHADVAAEALDDGDPAATRAALAHVRAASTEAGRELRRTLDVLRAAPGGIADLRALADLSAAAGLPVRVDVHGTPRALGADVDEAVYRIVQEAVTNARRHARPARVDVRVDYTPAGVGVRVSDDGPPSGAPPGAGQGLRGMRERVSLLGGTLHAGRCGDGFTIAAELPRGDPA